jgi:YbbR domain-containing protein
MNIFRFIFGNWALKVGALLLAVILYVGMVALQTTQQWPGTVSITPVNQPTTGTLIGTLPAVGHIRYLAPADVPITADTFTATINLADARVDPSASTLVKIKLSADDQRIQIIDYQPQQINVTLDKIVVKTIPVKLVTSTPPAGLSLGTTSLNPLSVEVSGGSSIVATVVRVEARVRIDSSGLDVNDDVVLVPVDANGLTINSVTLTPSTTHVRIQVGSQLRTQTVAVTPVVRGSPVAGYYVTSVEVNPLLVQVSGNANALSALNGSLATQPVSIAGATGDVTARVGLLLPQGVEAPGVTTVIVTVHLSSPSQTRTITIGLVPDGARADRIYSFSTPSVTVTLGGAQAALDAFDTSTLVGSISVGVLSPGTYSVQVSVNVPPGIKIVAISPGTITVTVTVPSPSPSPGSSPAATP